MPFKYILKSTSGLSTQMENAIGQSRQDSAAGAPSGATYNSDNVPAMNEASTTPSAAAGYYTDLDGFDGNALPEVDQSILIMEHL